MVGVPAMAADTDDRAEYLATSMYQRSLGIIRGNRAALLPPVAITSARTIEDFLDIIDAVAVFLLAGLELR